MNAISREPMEAQAEIIRNKILAMGRKYFKSPTYFPVGKNRFLNSFYALALFHLGNINLGFTLFLFVRILGRAFGSDETNGTG